MAAPATIRAGLLRTRLEVQKLTETADSVGETVETWTKHRNWWGGVRMLTGDETVEAARTDAFATHEVTMRHYTGLDVSVYRIVLLPSRRVLNILSINQVNERGAKMVLRCQEDV